MIDHVSLAVRDLGAATKLYAAMLATLGMTKLADRPTTVGFGKRYPEVWLNARPAGAASSDGAHVCLRARDEATVDAFFNAALAHGARSGGDPGPRQAAMTPYYAAFIEDPDGNRVEAATFPPAPQSDG